MNYTILLLDDDLRFRKMVVPGMTNKGLKVFEASTGAEAQELIKKHKFDLLIVDGVLPDTDGIKWLTRYRAAGGTSTLIFISAHWQASEVYQVLTKDLTVSQIIHKPVIPAVFAEQIYSEITRPHWTPTADREEER
ncbi:MAG: response regulator, partial [Candidatus Obscuribacterales bacterium]|nr:response regulator [Candidatus Obscuribacterales bacterium]